ncbi:hypothetical protein Ae201684P_019190 [Aphanomyces euteiches]|uniref:PARG catalytic Macro domain-containing protein n=1 Tax=Aphanomyces euteiches TaxID=100861 RepID=A0A6G0WJ17_9STRA|nr:hypothetical protein Ae201684_014750 [Aphanomyces euteiches]KAH9078087.1 hypothetical protein Ae201684P_019190 [Aphanomyces euteiches]KAH9158002.1 hypothetical protein AeRB84_000240 [Aphanomyces euteiches]
MAIIHESSAMSALQCAALQRTPSYPIGSFDDFAAYLDPKHKPEANGRRNFPALERAIQEFNTHFGYDFFTTLLPAIIEWAINVPESYPAESGLKFGAESEVSSSGEFIVWTCQYTSEVARFILANIFLLNTPTTVESAGSVDMFRVLQSNTMSIHGDVGSARVLSLLAYFHMQLRELDNPGRMITIERREWTGEIDPKDDWRTSKASLVPVELSVSSMESSSAKRFVNFANQNLHIHRIIPSATQEEVLFTCAPEAYIAIGLCARMQPNQVILIRNVQRYISYTGYLDTFRFADVLTPLPPPFDILSMDATVANHFTENIVHRDILKASLAFVDARPSAVSTGHWGCGVFGGNKTHKFIQQWIAASIRKGVTRLDYSVFGDTRLIGAWNQIIEAIRQRKWTIADVSKNLLLNYAKLNRSRREPYEQFVARVLEI